MNMRYSSKEEHEKFNTFYEESKRPTALDDINSTSPILAQVITYHLYNEYMIENWINHKFANGSFIFENTNISTSAKLKLAKNIGMSDGVYNAAAFLNTIRNKLAHNINIHPIDEKTLDKLIRLSDEINFESNIHGEIYSHVKDEVEKLSGDMKIKHILYIVLSTMSLKIWNYISTDMYHSTTHAIDEK